MVGVEALIPMRQVHEAGDEECCAGSQHDPERRLSYDHRRAEPAMPGNICAPALLQRRDQIGPQGRYGWENPADQPRDQRDQKRKAKDPQIHSGVSSAGNTAGNQPEHRWRAQKSQTAAGETACHAKRQALCQQLPYDSASAGAKSGKQSNFPLTVAHPHQQEVGDVATGNQQYQRHSAQHYHKQGARVAQHGCQVGLHPG